MVIKTILQMQPANELEKFFLDFAARLVSDKCIDSIDKLGGYGMPYHEDPILLERFSKLQGLAILNRSKSESHLFMNIIMKDWLSTNSKRGFGFLLHYLNMIYPDQYELVRLYHSKNYVNRYPSYIYEEDRGDRFATSRYRIKMSDDVDLESLSALAPTLQSFMPANAVVDISTTFDNIDDFGAGVAVVAIPIAYLDLSPF